MEKRFKAYVLTAGLPSLTDFTEEYGRGADAYQRIAAAIRKQFTEEQIRNYVETISPLEAVHYVGRSSPAAILMQFARWDSYISPEAARRYYDAASDPKEIRWYLCGHEMNDPLALKDRLYWLSKRLRLHPAAKP